MKKIEKLLLDACAYTVLISLLFLLFAQISGFTTATLSFWRFLLLTLFGAIIALANNIWSLKDWHYMLRLFIHYIALLAAFIAVFVISGNIKADGGAAIFVAIVIYTFLYALFFTIVYFGKKSVNAVDKKLVSKKKVTDKKEEKYSPRFK